MCKDWYSQLKHIQAIIDKLQKAIWKIQAYSRALKIHHVIQAFSRPTGDPVFIICNIIGTKKKKGM